MIAIDPMLTDFGLALIARAEQGETITFTTFAAGSGSVDTQAEADALTGLVTEEATFQVNSITRDGSTVTFHGALRSADIDEEFVYRELGMFAQGETGPAQLAWYVNFGENAGTIKASDSTVQMEHDISAVIEISASADVTIIFSSDVWASASDLLSLAGRVTVLEANSLYEAVFNVTIPSTGWTGSAAPYTIAVSLSGITADDAPIIDLAQSGVWSDDVARRDAWSCITRIVAANDQLNVTADAVPSVGVPIKVRCLRHG